MKKLNITKEAFEKSKYFKDKYGELEYVCQKAARCSRQARAKC